MHAETRPLLPIISTCVAIVVLGTHPGQARKRRLTGVLKRVALQGDCDIPCQRLEGGRAQEGRDVPIQLVVGEVEDVGDGVERLQQRAARSAPGWPLWRAIWEHQRQVPAYLHPSNLAPASQGQVGISQQQHTSAAHA